MLALLAATAAASSQKHVLFIVSDDLRPTLGAYGSQALTPTIDKLASDGVLFSRAFTQFPWCSPSRQSFMSGRRPDQTRAWTFTTSFRDALPNATSLAQHFKNSGWHTASVGKLFHGHNCVRGDANCGPRCHANATFEECIQQPIDADYPHSWDEKPVDYPRVGCGHDAQWCENDDQEDGCDFKVASTAIARLEAHAAARSSKPLFLAVGFRDDHLKCTPRAAAASALCVPRRPARPVPKLTSLASGRGRG